MRQVPAPPRPAAQRNAPQPSAARREGRGGGGGGTWAPPQTAGISGCGPGGPGPGGTGSGWGQGGRRASVTARIDDRSRRRQATWVRVGKSVTTRVGYRSHRRQVASVRTRVRLTSARDARRGRCTREPGTARDAAGANGAGSRARAAQRADEMAARAAQRSSHWNRAPRTPVAEGMVWSLLRSVQPAVEGACCGGSLLRREPVAEGACCGAPWSPLWGIVCRSLLAPRAAASRRARCVAAARQGRRRVRAGGRGCRARLPSHQ